MKIMIMAKDLFVSLIEKTQLIPYFDEKKIKRKKVPYK